MLNEEVYRKITDRIIAELEKGEIPWKKPWASAVGAVSHASGEPYSFLNQFMLTMQIHGENNKGIEYLTHKQCVAEGGYVKKGEKASMVVFWRWVKPKGNDTTTEGDDDADMIPLLRYYHLFEVGQCEGIERKYKLDAQKPPLERVSSAEGIITKYFDREPCRLEICESNRAYYSPSEDIVHVPHTEQYEDIQEYYSTLFHEMTHSTGHHSRLNRFEGTQNYFGSSDYSKEELVAELGASYLCNQIGMTMTIENSAAYIQGWLKHLRNDKRLIVSAASRAEKAVRYILNGKENEV